MRLFTCRACGNRLYFENVACTRCGATLGFLPDTLSLAALEAADDGAWRPAGEGGDRRYRMCANYTDQAVCNWMVEARADDVFCVACRLNRTIPDLRRQENIALWHKLEIEKRRLVYSLLRLRLPVLPKGMDAAGLAFDFLADPDPRFSERGRVLTGHADGLITINIAEADSVVREHMRAQMDEPYRTVLGHFRHESGHYYWDRLVREGARLDAFRARFGDETQDYAAALERHHAQGPPADWAERFVSAYASCHPWEDWAETWAHYLHIIDTLETAEQFGLHIRPRVGDDRLAATPDFDPYAQPDFETLIEHWLPLTFALNSLNRSMGLEHAYPFVLSPTVMAKLAFVHRVVRDAEPGAQHAPV